MQIQILSGVQKYNLEIPESTSSSADQETVNNNGQLSENSGQEIPKEQQEEQSAEWTLRRLKEEIEKLTGIPVDNQRLIKKGSTLFGDDTLVSTIKLTPGEKIMVVGNKPHIIEDPALKSLVTIERTILEGIEGKIKDVDERLQGIQQGFLTKDLMSPALNELDKQLKILGEDCMKTLELMDAMQLSDDGKDQARMKRRNLVHRVQTLLRWHDQLIERLKDVSANMNGKRQITF